MASRSVRGTHANCSVHAVALWCAHSQKDPACSSCAVFSSTVLLTSSVLDTLQW